MVSKMLFAVLAALTFMFAIAAPIKNVDNTDSLEPRVADMSGQEVVKMRNAILEMRNAIDRLDKKDQFIAKSIALTSFAIMVVGLALTIRIFVGLYFTMKARSVINTIKERYKTF